MGSRQGTRWLAWAAGASLVSGAISGCGDGGAEPTATPTTTSTSAVPTTPAATPSPLVTAVPLPVMPPEMANNDAAGAEAAVRYFVELADYTLSSGDLEPWKIQTDSACVFCNSISEQSRDIEARDIIRDGGRLEVVAVMWVDARDGDIFIVEAVVMQAGYRYLDENRTVVEEAEAVEDNVQFALKFESGRWVLIAAGTSSEEAKP